MEVDMNNLRKQAVNAYERLAKKLNSSIRSKDGPYEFVMPNYDASNTGTKYWPHISIRASDIKEEMEDLRRTIGFIALVHDPENPAIKDVFSEMFPESHDGMTVFNPEEDE